ncbi:bis-aminopropyl spermidine synthase family protein [candidate division WWE3 bacterium]|nr:bis-aminopropyl spermidine synthase family protein [candidate division WWE3 bacterium]
MINLIYEASKKSGVPAKKIEDLIFYLKQVDTISLQALIRKTGISKTGLENAASNLSTVILVVGDKYSIAPNAKATLPVFTDYRTEEDIWLILKDRKFFEISNKLEEFSKQRDKANRELDQFYATPETVAKRASLLNYFTDICGKRILFLGDDDLTSFATATIGKQKEVVVADVDLKILANVTTISSSANLNISTLEYDAREILPKNLKGRFDIVFTDPPYSPNGFKLFLSRAIESLDLNNQGARIYICYGNSDRAKEKFLPIYQIINEAGLMTRWVFDKFNRYNGADSIGSTSSILVLDTTPKTIPLIKGKFNESIYTNN